MRIVVTLPSSPVHHQVAEFVAVLRMRSVDVSAAAARSEAFVRRMWSGTVCDQHHPETHPLRTLGLITCLGRWLFRALCFSLAPDPPCSPDIPDRLEVNIETTGCGEASGETGLQFLQALKNRVSRNHRCRIILEKHQLSQISYNFTFFSLVSGAVA